MCRLAYRRIPVGYGTKQCLMLLLCRLVCPCYWFIHILPFFVIFKYVFYPLWKAWQVNARDQIFANVSTARRFFQCKAFRFLFVNYSDAKSNKFLRDKRSTVTHYTTKFTAGTGLVFHYHFVALIRSPSLYQ